MNINDIRQLFDYTDYANHLVLDAAEKLTDEQLRQNVNISHGSIFGTLAHMAGAEWVWLSRWQGVSPSEIWTSGTFADLAALRARWQEIEGERRQILEGLTTDELHRELSYRNIKGDAFTLPLVQQMQHVVNHATLHRGQVVGMIRQLGIAPPAVDLLFYLLAQKK
ncbi:MAG TPA: DinB family protein [Blastocatellia bacterium]|nr:DinB family protein [Blastocatellia bacterium]HMX24941.1 DinB family protein [Blastocatellia bacterium]HMY75566.1 DinB family protein [Blastocatellia bacterium]HMZ16849.1 DinB family protein [Blastocatellia bacterium]HNG29151.1 DinB family protein [Blastocatellia bacterium]